MSWKYIWFSDIEYEEATSYYSYDPLLDERCPVKCAIYIWSQGSIRGFIQTPTSKNCTIYVVDVESP